MRIAIFLLSSTVLSGIYLRRYLEHIRGIHVTEIFKRKYRRLLKIPSKHVMAVKKAAELQAKPKKPPVIQKEQLKENQPGDFERADQIFNKADYLLSRGEIEEAKKLLVQALSLNVGHEGSNNKLGMIYLEEGNFSKAEILFQQLTLLFPKNAKYFSHLGLTYFNQNKLLEAKDAYEKAVELDQEKPARFISLALIYEQLKDDVYAVKHFQKARKVAPRNLQTLLAFSEYFIRHKQPDAARELLEEVIRISPRNDHAAKLLKELI